MQPYRFSNFDKKKDLRFQTYKSIFRDYSNFATKQLFDKNNQESLNYLSKRGLKESTIEEFKLGYVPWKNNFYEDLINKYTEEDISFTGLYYKSDKTGKYIDRFNSRVIFPINNISGETVAFGGRIIRDSKLAKYINSPETEFYKKGSMIFNLDKAKDLRSETDNVLIVEGYMDVVSLYASGIKNVISNSGTALTERQIDLIWKFFSNPTICLDGDISGQHAALRIAEKLFPFINEKNKIYFSIIPDGKDPDDFIRENGKDLFIKLLGKKEIIQDFLWNYYLAKIDKNNPFEISKFEKEIKKLSYSIKDETLKKYVLEDYLNKIQKLTPIQSSRSTNVFPFKKKKDHKILNETKILYQKTKDLSKIQILEFSIIFLIINHSEIAIKQIKDLNNLKFTSTKNENLKSIIIELLTNNKDGQDLTKHITSDYKELIKEIEENPIIRLISRDKNDQEILNLLEDLIISFKEQHRIQKIENLEKKLANNLDENSFSELIKLKNQLNRD
tara:strand:+ start:1 stop:1509 length:1509 start_codon:yes stop_codon:yes gene_type:complete